MLRAIVVDDEPLIRKFLVQTLEEYQGLMIVGNCGSVAEAEVLISSCNPDVVFLDIHLSDGSGFNLLQKIGEINFNVVFITSYEQYAIKAIKCGAFDYILKPVDTEELDETIKRILESSSEADEKVNTRIDILQNELAGKREFITLRFNESLRIVNFGEIIYCNSESGYTTFYLDQGEKVVVSRGLKEYEKLLPDNMFLRIHKSYLVNKIFIKEYLKEGYIRLKDGTSLPVAIRRKDDILRYFQ